MFPPEAGYTGLPRDLWGIKVFVWIVDSERDMKKFFKMDVDGIITNRPDRAKRILGQPLTK